MRISSQFNRFMHGVVLAEVNRLRTLKTSQPAYLIRPFYLSPQTLKQVLKYLDYDYPRTKDGTPLSYKGLSVLEMLSHIAFIETLLASNGVSPKYLIEFKKEIGDA